MRTLTTFISTKRSGHHAVINWLYAGMGRPTCFYNNINGRMAKSGEQTLFGRDGHNHTRTVKCSPSAKSDPGYHIAMNFEGKLPQTVTAIFKAIEDRGVPAYFEQCIILRDPLNTLASCARHFSSPGRPKNLIKFYEQALALQKLIGEAQAPHYLRPDKLIAYNRWLCDSAYREWLAADFAMARTPDLPDSVTHHGGGSSFSGGALDDSRALLSRWRDMSDDPLFLSVFLDPGLVNNLKAYPGVFEDSHAPDATAIDALCEKARASQRAHRLYRDWFTPLKTHMDKLAAIQLAIGTPGYVPAKLRLRLALGVSRYRGGAGERVHAQDKAPAS